MENYGAKGQGMEKPSSWLLLGWYRIRESNS